MKAATASAVITVNATLLFQSTPPVKAATVFLLCAECVENISIHAAREGGDKKANQQQKKEEISIHAAREGGDDK